MTSAANPIFLFAPGAGAATTSSWMERWGQDAARDRPRHLMDYDSVREGRKMPDRMPTLIAAHRAALEAVKAKASESSGCACYLSLETKVHALGCLDE